MSPDGSPASLTSWDSPTWASTSGPDVMAHYFTAAIPRLAATPVGTNTTAGNYYQNYQAPGVVEGGTDHRRYGGFMRDFPLQGDLEPITSSNDWQLADAKAEIRNAMSAGLTGFTLNLLSIIGHDGDADTNGHWTRVRRMMTAAEQVNAEDGTSFRIMPMPDGTAGWATALVKDADGVVDATASADALAHALSVLAASPAVYRTGGKVTVGPFAPEAWPANVTGRTAADRLVFWKRVKATLLGTYGLDVRFWFCYVAQWTGTSAAPLFDEIAYGHGRWGDRDYQSVTAETSNNRGAPALCRSTYRKPWMHFGGTPMDSRPVSAGATTYRTWEGRGTRTVEGSWLAAIDGGAEFNQIPTWNDFSENAHVAPSRAHGYALLDLQAWFVARYRTGAFPLIRRDGLYLAHRRHRTDATVSETSLQTAFSTVAGPTPMANEIEVRVFSTDAATVEILVDGAVIQSTPVTGGMSIVNAPLPASGLISARLKRSGAVVPRTLVTSDVPVLSTIQNDDYLYRVFSSRRQQ